MGVNGYWTEVLGLFKYKLHEKLSKDKFIKVGINIDILFNKSQTNIIACATTNKPLHASPDILQKVKEYHMKIIKSGVIPAYVFGEPTPLLKKEEKEYYACLRMNNANDWFETLEKIQKDPNITLSNKEI